jgi:hypothetical protein
MKKLKIALMEVVEEVCEVLHDKKMPMRNWTRIKKNEDQMSCSVELRPDIPTLMVYVHLNTEKLASLKQLLEVVQASPKLSSQIFCDAARNPVSEPNRDMWMRNFLLNPILSEYFYNLGAINFDEKVAQSSIDKFITKLETPISKFKTLTPLVNLKLAMEVLDIAPGIRLRKIKENEIEKWINDYTSISINPISSMVIYNIDCAAEITNKACADINEAQSLLHSLMHIIRLITDRKIYICFTENEVLKAERPLLNQLSQSWGYSLRLMDMDAIIDEAVGIRLVDLWQKIQQCPNIEKIDLAFKRWSETVERLSVEDMLIDYWIALESLFASDSNQEVKFRASLRIASYLGKTADKRKEIYNDMRCSYDWRSAIVHGDFRKPGKIKELNKKSTLHEITEKTRSYLRESLFQLIESEEEFDPTSMESMLLSKP